MIAALRNAKVEVIECQVALWKSIEDRVNITKGGWKKPAFWWRVMVTYGRLILRIFKMPDFDILIVGYPGQFDVFLAKLLSVLKRKPLVWDVFMSIYLVAKERGLDQENRFIVNLIRKIEARALRLPDLLIQDTAEYVNWFYTEYGISPERFCLVPTGADDRIFKPIELGNPTDDDQFIVLYYGTFIPNHGVMKIAHAVKFLAEENDILFEFIGEGPEKAALEEFLEKHNIKNVRLHGWMSQEELLVYIAKSDICLGAFGDTPQSLMTVQNKIYECMAMGKLVITGESVAVRAAFPPDTIVVCDRENPEELAKIIADLSNNRDFLQNIQKNAREIFLKNYSICSLGRKLNCCLNEIVSAKETLK
jgi:glycosyltransferase involved in cell wall biosynthesis